MKLRKIRRRKYSKTITVIISVFEGDVWLKIKVTLFSKFSKMSSKKKILSCFLKEAL
jgi:hypothetical protein